MKCSILQLPPVLLSVLLVGIGQQAAAADAKPQDVALVERVAGRMIAVADPVEGWLWPPIVAIDPDTAVNAFATIERVGEGSERKIQPRIYVLQGLLDGVVQGREDRLAMIVAHELAHVLLKHVEAATPGSRLVAAAISREQEMASDLLGVQLALKAGYDYKELLACAQQLHKDHPYSSFEGLNADHPSWSDRIAFFATNEPELWRAMSAFENGVYFLLAEQYGLAERCFRQVTREMPSCYEGWANLGYARLMMYCDALDPDNLRDFDIGHLVVGGFYRKAGSLERGINEELWYDATGALREAIRLKPELVLPRATLAVAYLVHPAGKDVGAASELFDQVIKALRENKVEPLDPVAKAALLVNAGVVQMSAGQLASSKEFFDEATAAFQELTRADAAGTGGLAMAALRYNRGVALASSAEIASRRSAVKEFEAFLTSSQSRSSWWPLAYERYAKLCRDLGDTPKSEQDLAGKKSELRMVTEVELPGNIRIGLSERLEDVAAQLGEGTKVPVVRRTNVVRLSYEDRGLDLVVADRVLAIFVKGAHAPPVTLRTTGLGGQKKQVRVGMTKAEWEEAIGRQVVDFRELLSKQVRYRFYRDLGLAVRFENSVVSEIVIAQLPEDAPPS